MFGTADGDNNHKIILLQRLLLPHFWHLTNKLEGNCGGSIMMKDAEGEDS